MKHTGIKQIGFLVYPELSLMALAVVSAFETANLHVKQPAYEIRFVAEHDAAIKTSSGLTIQSASFYGQQFDTFIIGGATDIKPASAAVIEYLQASQPQMRRLAAICTGAFVLAEAGLLDGRRATTHWLHARDLQQQYPTIQVEGDRIFINDGNVWTSAGMSAGIDLALALIEEDLGAEIAKAVARKLVVYHRRAGGQSQFSSLLELEPKSDRIRMALAYAKDHLHQPLSVEQLASAVHLSPRQFSRTFTAETGQSPAKAIEHLRVEMAKGMIEQTRHPLDSIARMTGFADTDRMRRAFLRSFGQPPQVLRRLAHLHQDVAVHVGQAKVAMS